MMWLWDKRVSTACENYKYHCEGRGYDPAGGLELIRQLGECLRELMAEEEADRDRLRAALQRIVRGAILTMRAKAGGHPGSTSWILRYIREAGLDPESL